MSGFEIGNFTWCTQSCLFLVLMRYTNSGSGSRNRVALDLHQSWSLRLPVSSCRRRNRFTKRAGRPLVRRRWSLRRRGRRWRCRCRVGTDEIHQRGSRRILLHQKLVKNNEKPCPWDDSEMEFLPPLNWTVNRGRIWLIRLIVSKIGEKGSNRSLLLSELGVSVVLPESDSVSLSWNLTVSLTTSGTEILNEFEPKKHQTKPNFHKYEAQ